MMILCNLPILSLCGSLALYGGFDNIQLTLDNVPMTFDKNLHFSSGTCFRMTQTIQDWTKHSGWRILHSRPRCVPGDPGFPRVSERTKFTDYNSTAGFYKSPI